jgi:hypothetical protein
MGSDDPPAPKAIVTDTAPASNPPMVTENPDGTITLRKEPSKADAKDVRGKKGLVIPAQVIVPFIPKSSGK